MSLFTNNINITGTNDFNPRFTWQIGVGDSNYPLADLRFRATVRPLSNDESSNRIPSQTVLYEETGIILSADNLGEWQYTLAKNLLSTNGPYRDYQVVIEAHDLQGNTSAGNMVGTSSEDGWTAYPYGYDAIAVTNERQTGIELSNQILTQGYDGGAFVTGSHGYASRQFVGPNGEVVIRFTSGTFTPDLVGGYIYTSFAPFPKLESAINTGYWGNRVQKTRCSFEPRNGFIYSPNAAFDVRGIPEAYISVSFYDKLDEILLDNGVNISTGLYMSNNAKIYGDAAGGTFSIGGTNTISTVATTGNPDAGRTRQLIGSGTEIIRTWSPPNLSGQNIEAVTTTILYMSIPVTNFYTGANGNIVLGNPYVDDGGLGGDAISFPYGNKNPGGFPGSTLVWMFDGTVKRIDQVQVGEQVRSWRLIPTFDYRTDNWESVSGGIVLGYQGIGSIGPGGGYPPATGYVTKIHVNQVNDYFEFITASNSIYSGSHLSFFLGHPETPNSHHDIRQFSAENIQIGARIKQDIHPFQPFQEVPTNTLITNYTRRDIPQTMYHLEIEPFKTFYIKEHGSTSSIGTGIYVHDAILNYR